MFVNSPQRTIESKYFKKQFYMEIFGLLRNKEHIKTFHGKFQNKNMKNLKIVFCGFRSINFNSFFQKIKMGSKYYTIFL
jgi:hypothetical protein